MVTGRNVAGLRSSVNSSKSSASTSSRAMASVPLAAAGRLLLRPGDRTPFGAAEKSSDLVERTLCRRQSDALQGRTVLCPAQRLETFERQRQVRAALAGHEGMNLVDDDRVGGDEPLARARREQQKQRFRRGDQNVRGLAQETGTFGGRRVSGSDADLWCDHVDTGGTCHVGNAFERCAQVALDIHCQCLQRRHVDHTATILCWWWRREHQAIEAPQERAQCLAAACRREDEGRFAARDRRPPLLLRPCRRLEGCREPLANGGMKQIERGRPASHRTDEFVVNAASELGCENGGVIVMTGVE